MVLTIPTQILKQAQRVWRWAIDAGIGKAWSYFVFAICQWLPTNYRLNYDGLPVKKRCSLCMMDVDEDMSHLLICPALVEEQLSLNDQISQKLEDWKIPFSIRLFFQEKKRVTPNSSRQHGQYSIATE